MDHTFYTKVFCSEIRKNHWNLANGAFLALRNQLLMSILRILTPEEISELTTTSTGSERVSLTSIVSERLHISSTEERKNLGSSEDETELEGAKILPFVGPKESVFEMGERVKGLLGHFMIESKTTSENLLGPKRKKKRLRKTTKETSTFIIEEKRKFNHSYTKLKSMEVIDLYRRNAKVDIEHQRKNKDDLSKTTQSGILVNKKQA